MLKEGGVVANLTSPYCQTLDAQSLMNIFVCFESPAIPSLNDCYLGLSLLPNISDIDFYIENNDLWVVNVNTEMNGTLINIFCLSNYDIKCNATNNVKIMILNSELSKDSDDWHI